ncbi:hypothetical protein L210DRAFT_3760928 [Boletus edulis BED1]|uniref:U3 small nucleolar RNA-associated protein 10 n=1 Tax=Boletus edulis BED1 TaxID=1328754 RepID=A0AAD4BTY4_BOLED|nr:hypothetical protein L210DRAFT_3760928 [Boletus edulis BED1]
MPSVLASQLAASTSLNASLLQDRSKKRQTESYLFTGRDADLHDLDSIHALASTAFTHLRSLSPAFSSKSLNVGPDGSPCAVDFENVLFSDAARALDRTLQTSDYNANLDQNINAFLALLGPWLMDAPTNKASFVPFRSTNRSATSIRTNEFNVPAILALFLPYHESPHFVKMLSILHIQPNSSFSFLLPFKSAAKPLARSALVKTMVSDTEVARFVANLLPVAVKCSHPHRTLLAFHVATMHDYISSSPSLDDGVLAFTLPSLLTPLHSSQKDANIALGSFVLLSTLSQRVNLKPAAVSAIIIAMTTQVRGARGSGKGSVPTAHFVKTAVAICASQQDIQTFPLSASQLCTKMSGFSDELSKVITVVGAQHFILPLLRSLGERIHEHRVSSLYATLINTTNAPVAVIKELSRILIRLATLLPNADHGIVEAETREKIIRAARSLLSSVHQRHLELLRGVADNILSEASAKAGEQNEDRKERKKMANELLTSFSLVSDASVHPLAESSNINEVVVASASTSKETRVAAVEKMYSMLEAAQNKMSALDMASIQSALLGRVYDTHIGVLQALYASPDLFLSTITSTTSPQQLLDMITSQLSPTPPARAVLCVHAAFLSGPLIKTHPDLTSAVQQTALFPFLFASKTKFRTARSLWTAIKGSGNFQMGWLRGCGDVWEQMTLLGEEADKDGNDGDNDKVCEANLGVADKIAGEGSLYSLFPDAKIWHAFIENILAASNSAKDVTVLLSKLHDPLPHARALAYLVCRALLMRNVGRSTDLTGPPLYTCYAPDSAGSRRQLELGRGTKAFIKPGGRSTLHALQASILVLIPALPVPPKFSAAWISVFSSVDQTPSDPSQCYVSLMQEIYALASVSAGTVPNQFSTSVLQALFLNLRDSSLAFLLGILLSSSPSLERVRTHALLHILAFVRGHSSASAIDFQTVLPSLIAVILDVRSDKRDRALIFEIISLLGGTSEKKHVYALDTIYGPASAQLQYVDTNALSAYAKALVNNKEQLIQDANYIQVFHQKHLEESTTKYRRRILCFLLSHVVSHPFPSARIALLLSIESVVDSSKSHMLRPVMKDLMQNAAPIAQMFGTSFEAYVSLVVAGFLMVTAAILQDQNDNESWLVFLSGLQFYLHSNSDAAARKLYVNALGQRIFSQLDPEKRSEICTVLLQAGCEGGEAHLASRALLGKLLKDVKLINHLLAQFRPEQPESDAPVNKRAKLDSSPHASKISKLQPLTLLAEVLGTTEIPRSLDLVANLLETLNRIVRSDLWGPSDTSYVCQMLMAAIERSASEGTKPSARPLRLDVLVELIRVTDNPQTFNEALLLMASLARLTPDSVLHNIMPIFTFMGSNVFHRDDSYSFKVVQHTIDNIVPVMVSSLKTKHLDGFDLYVGARDFLRIFTDASNHIPRHRRQNFFVHLTGVLGARAFLAPVCMLLIDKVTNRASRQTPEEAQNTLILPSSLLRHFDRSLQLFVLTEVLKECLRLRSQLLTPENTVPAILDYPRDGEHSLSTSATLKRRIQALVLFVSTSLTPAEPDAPSNGEGGNTTDVITHLLDLATPPTGDAPEDDVVTIVAAAQSAIERIMNVISAREFLTASRVMLASEDTRVKAGALGVVSARIPLVTEKLRQECQATVIELVGLIRNVIERQSAGPLVESALAALKALGSTCCDGEETTLLSTLPHVLKVVRSRTSAAAAVSVLPCYIAALGPRIIPHFRDIAQECISILREGLKGKTQLADAGEAALATLQTKLYIDYSAVSTIQNNPLTGLTKAISKRTSAEVLLPVLYDLWPNVDKAQTKEDVNGMIGYFALLKRALHAAPRPEVLDHLRPLFKVFMGAFDVKMVFGFTEGEPHVISAFTELVVKLNENAFRPLFRRMHDWAFADEKATDERRITFCHVYTTLLDYFKGLMNPYMSTLLRPLTEVLQSFSSSLKTGPTDLALWLGIITVLTKSLEADDGVFWREDKLSTLLPHLLSQVPCVVHLPSPFPDTFAPSETPPKTPRERLVSCLVSVTVLLPNTSSDLLKRLNLDLLMHTRSEDARVRILALTCATEMWRAEGGKLVGFVGETATFITECAEDDNDSVVREAHQLKDAVERVAGSISGL